MERGTEGERRAVRERWAAMERKRASATRTGCEPLGQPMLGPLLASFGALALVGGLWNCWSVFRS